MCPSPPSGHAALIPVLRSQKPPPSPWPSCGPWPATDHSAGLDQPQKRSNRDSHGYGTALAGIRRRHTARQFKRWSYGMWSLTKTLARKYRITVPRSTAATVPYSIPSSVHAVAFGSWWTHASGTDTGRSWSNGSWPRSANYAAPRTRSKSITFAHSKISTPRGGNNHPTGSRAWPPAGARPWSSAASATRTSTPDVPHADHDEHWRASCYGKRARLVRWGAVGKGPGQLAPRRRLTLRHVRICEGRGAAMPPATVLGQVQVKGQLVLAASRPPTKRPLTSRRSRAGRRPETVAFG